MSKSQSFQGQRFHLKRSGYYQNRLGQNMHRIVWQALRGPIPEGFDIHHIDEDKANNSVENLACISRQEHVVTHFADPERLALQREVVAVAQAVSYVKDVERCCAHCAAPMLVRRVDRTRQRFCSAECKSKWDYAHKIGFREATCEACGKPFETKCRKTRTCSYECGWVIRRR